MRDPTRRCKTRYAVLAGAIFVGAGAGACQGVIGGVAGDNGSPSAGGPAANASGRSAAGSSSSPGTTGSAGSSGTGGSNNGGGVAGPPVLDVGRTTLRRLNRTEYNNTVHDLLGTTQTPASVFPADDVSDGFDTIGDTLGTSTVLTQLLESAATSLVAELFARPPSDPIRQGILTCNFTPGAEQVCAQKILAPFIARAFRRPAQPTEVASFVQLVASAIALGGAGDAGASSSPAQDGLEAAMEAVLLSPNFLFFVEPDTAPGSTAAVPLNDYEVATRLSYLAWSSMPDDALLAAAAAGQLAGQPTGVAAQLNRMLADPRASAFAQNFGGQWLQVNYLDTVTPSPAVFPTYDDSLRTSATTETVRFFQDLVDEDLPLETLVTANFSMLNARLGMEYGVPVTGQGFIKTSLAGTPRVGILTQDSLLMGKSYPDRTSPVKRGYFVLSQLICSPPPPPPANVPALAAAQAAAGATMRQQLDAHALNPMCSGCHTLMDPIGYGLENFDAIGAYRTMDKGQPIDATGTFPGGKMFDGAAQLASALASDPRYLPCVTQQLLTYGVGRSFDATDARSYAAALGAQMAGQGKATWRGLISAVASSDAFTTRRGEAP